MPAQLHSGIHQVLLLPRSEAVRQASPQHPIRIFKTSRTASTQCSLAYVASISPGQGTEYPVRRGSQPCLAEDQMNASAPSRGFGRRFYRRAAIQTEGRARTRLLQHGHALYPNEHQKTLDPRACHRLFLSLTRHTPLFRVTGLCACCTISWILRIQESKSSSASCRMT